MDTEDLIYLRRASRSQRLKARLGMIVFLYNGSKLGWTGEAPFYLFKCPNKACINHTRLVIDYAHGYEGSTKRLTCPDCGRSKYFSITLQSIWKDIVILIRLKAERRKRSGKRQKIWN